MMKRMMKTGCGLLLVMLLLATLVGCGSGEPSEPDYSNLTGDPFFYDVRWGESIDEIIKKAGVPDGRDDNFLTYNDQEILGVSCKVVLVVDFSYSYPGLYSVTHTFDNWDNFEYLKKEMTDLLGEPIQSNDKESATWEIEGTTVYLDQGRISFVNTSV